MIAIYVRDGVVQEVSSDDPDDQVCIFDDDNSEYEDINYDEQYDNFCLSNGLYVVM